MKITVDIQEDNPGCQWCHITIKLSGHGKSHPGFKLLSLENMDSSTLEAIDESLPLFRPEYAKELKRKLEA